MTRNGAHIVIEHGGETHYLCCPQCQSEFERDPDRYVRRQRPAPSLREV
jgi:YHS domain-containing protein